MVGLLDYLFLRADSGDSKCTRLMNLSLKCTNFLTFCCPWTPLEVPRSTYKNTVGNTVDYMMVYEKYTFYYLKSLKGFYHLRLILSQEKPCMCRLI